MNTVIETVTVGSAPQGIAISTDGAFAYVANTSSQTVSKVDLGASPAAVIATIQVGTSPVGVAVTPDGTRVYVTNSGSNDVSVINTSSNTVIATTPVGPSPVGVAVTPDGTHVFVTNSGSKLTGLTQRASGITVVDGLTIGSPGAEKGRQSEKHCEDHIAVTHQPRLPSFCLRIILRTHRPVTPRMLLKFDDVEATVAPALRRGTPHSR